MQTRKSFYYKASIVLVVMILTVVFIQKVLMEDASSKPYRIVRQSMGTAFTIMVAERLSKNEIEEKVELGFAEINRLNDKYSPYNPKSVVSQLNKSQGKPVKVDQETLMLFQFSQNMSEISGGVFDITFKSFGRMWNLKPEKFQLPDEEKIKERLDWINYKNVVIDVAAQEVSLNGEHTQIGLGAFVKGYAVDKAAEVFRKNGVNNFLINGGGDIYFSGHKFGKPWIAGIQHPREDRGKVIASFPITQNGSLVTSGDYERFVDYKGKRYHHIIDPRTGYPSEGVQSVSVWASKALEADAFATAIFILGPEKGLELSRQKEGIKAVIIDAHGEFHGDLDLFQSE